MTGITNGPVAEDGCHCGAVNHCRGCRKSSSAPVSLFAGYRAEQVETGQGVPKVYESSLGVRRSFCEEGGTPLSYEAKGLPGEVYVMVGALDNPEPEAFEPETHARDSQKPEWLYIRGELPRYRESSKPQ